MILRELMLGSHRFEEFEAQLRASPALISQRLKKMFSEGVISRKQYESSPPRFEYRLTKKGLDLWPLVLGLKHWGDKWGDWPDDSPAVLVHKACGHTTGMKMVCESCGNQLTPHNVEIQMLEPMRTERATLREAKLASNAAKTSTRQRESSNKPRRAGQPR